MEGKEDKKGEDDEYYGSDYDDEGKYIWGKEGEEWEWYYKEDKAAHEAGQ